MEYRWYDVLGTIGVGCIVGAYLLLQVGSLRVEQLRYSLLNAVGAGLVLLSLAFDFNASAAMVEGFWLLISVYGVIKGVMWKLHLARLQEQRQSAKLREARSAGPREEERE